MDIENLRYRKIKVNDTNIEKVIDILVSYGFNGIVINSTVRVVTIYTHEISITYGTLNKTFEDHSHTELSVIELINLYGNKENK